MASGCGRLVSYFRPEHRSSASCPKQSASRLSEPRHSMRARNAANRFNMPSMARARAFAASGATTMAMVGSEIERLIKQAFPGAQVIVVDLAGDGDHFGARITSEAFKGKSRVQQHKMVYDALQGQMGGALHALALETSVPK
jgi:stress-induced morphogen